MKSDSDYELAIQLQEIFNNETSVENPSKDLTYVKNKRMKQGESLVDPSWELIDPTPNIYDLFIQFSERFFWNKLGSVTVDWSKRMTSCAGVCSYNYRGGMCRITLSEPLLKLRPRRDLVQTLLHEMIHAYLFVTHNNRDRDGHGPEFHKHMNRINNEAGTKITVYHDFHDEVHLYQQHWWRCNGKCQSKPPFFGIVRRAMNRAPSPNDFWWAEHQLTCGGTFIKVKEPDNFKARKPKSRQTLAPINDASSSNTKQTDIRNFIPVSPKKSQIIIDLESTTIQNNLKRKASELIDSSIRKVVPVISKKPPEILTIVSKSPSTQSELKVKATISHVIKCPLCNNSFSESDINAHLDCCLNEGDSIDSDSGELIKCPICEIIIDNELWESHYQSCNRANKKILDKCSICEKHVSVQEYDSHVAKCLLKQYDNISNKDQDTIIIDDYCGPSDTSQKYNCPVCSLLLNESEMNAHLDQCLT